MGDVPTGLGLDRPGDGSSRMRTTLLLLGAFFLSACGGSPPEPFAATVTFRVTTPDGHLTKPATTFLVVERPDGVRLINGWAEDAGENEVSGRHNFPKNSSGPGIAVYYPLVFVNSGWKKGVDFTIEEDAARLEFPAVTAIDAGSTSDEIRVVVETRER
jgi:hypothetical protein